MTPLKIARLARAYEVELKQVGVTPQRIDVDSTFLHQPDPRLLRHALYLCQSIPDFVFLDGKLGKANRHLTATQMCLSQPDWYTLHCLMSHNRL